MRRVPLVVIAIVVAILALPSRAHANGRFPASNAIAFDPSDPARVYLRATFGLAISTDGGHAWDWVCERALGFSGPEDPTLAVMAEGSIAVSLFEGLSVSHDQSCTYAMMKGPLEKKVFVDTATRAPAYDVAVAISSGYANHTNDAGDSEFVSEIWTTSDHGNTWKNPSKPFDPALLLETVEWAASDAKRIYVSAVRAHSNEQSGVLLRSDDAGVTWKERPIALQKGERSPYIAAIDPKDANVVYIRILGAVDAGSRLVVTRDGGLTYKTILQTTSVMKGFALGAGGTKVYAGGPKDGLLVASAPAYAFTKTSSVQIQCLAQRGDELWACSGEASGFSAGVSRDDGATFEPRFHLRDLRGPIPCAQGTRTAELCKADWPSLRATLGIEDAKPVDAGSAAPASSTPTPAPSSSKCSCDAIGARARVRSTRDAFGAFLVVALAAFVARVRRSRRHGTQR